jgi:ATP/maltotriose-dependent transcriptional regulator MalT
MLDRRLDQALEYGTLAAALEDRNVVTDQRIDINITVGSVLLFSGRGDEGWPMLESAIASANAAGFEASAARAFRMGGSSASVLVEYPLATAWLAQGMEFTARTEHWNDHNYLVAHSAHVAWATGDLAVAEQLAARALADGQGVTTRITALIVLGYVALSRREDGTARAHLEEARDLAEQLGEVQRLSPALWGLAELAARAGEPRMAVKLCERGLESSERVGDAAYAFPFVVTGVRAKLAVRDLAGAHEWFERCSALLTVRSIPGTMPALQHARGLIALAEGQTGHARTHLELALAAWDESGRFWEGIEAMHDLAACAIRSRRPSDAAHHTAEANERAAVAGAVALIDDPKKVAPPEVGPLSARELDVARLVTSGLTNRQIGESLTISPKTVSTHVEHILAKLGVARRAEIAAWVTASEAAV